MMLKFISKLLLLLGIIKGTISALGGYNVAFQKATYQSSTYHLGSGSYRAVSNNTNTNYADGGCTHTNATKITWWSVDLGEIVPVMSVIITRRLVEQGYVRRLSNFEIYGSNETYFLPNTTDARLCKKVVKYVPIGETLQFDCINGRFPARYVIIWKNMTSPSFKRHEYFLSLCNVEVIAECPYGWYGKNCSKECSQICRSSNTCNKKTGVCLNCNAGYQGEFCTKECNNGTYGDRCLYNCSKNCLYGCDKFTDDGICIDGKCKPGYQHGGNCSEECNAGRYGDNCVRKCHCKNKDPCDKVDGSCSNGCEIGFYGLNCSQECPDGKYGENCEYDCSANCVNPVCQKHSEYGICKGGCKPRFTGDNCTGTMYKFVPNCIPTTQASYVSERRNHFIRSSTTSLNMNVSEYSPWSIYYKTIHPATK